MLDYRKPENRMEYFTKLYRATLEHRIHPGLVYVYLPELARRNGWGEEAQMWFAFLNGMTQSPITSLRLYERIQPDASAADVDRFENWFNENWASLHFDTDRLKNKRNTVAAVRSYLTLVQEVGSQRALYRDASYEQAWSIANRIHGFGRLSTFSYLEYVHLLGFGPDCDDLMLRDKEGSRSHRNGMLFLFGRDDLVWDKRINNGFKGYRDFGALVAQLDDQVPGLLEAGGEGASLFTLESALCCFKNSFFSRRYMGVYADMAWERILWAEQHGLGAYATIFRQIREYTLPDWLRWEVTGRGQLDKGKLARQFVDTGHPYRGEHFL